MNNEHELEALLLCRGIQFSRPERNPLDPATLDFFLTDFGIYVEVKQYHTPRIADQLAKVPEKTTAIVLVGPNSVEDFKRLCDAISPG